MNHYIYTLAISMFLIGQISLVNIQEGIPSDTAVFAETSVWETAVEEPVDENELIISYIFGDDAEVEEDITKKLLTVGQAREIVSRAHLEKYGVEYLFADENVDLEAQITRAEFARLFYPLCVIEPQKNICEFITDVEQDSELYNEISTLYKVGIIAGSNNYGSFLGNEGVKVSAAKAMISRLNHPEERVEYNPHLNSSSYAIDFACVLQNPELPTGCEVTSLTSVLNYHGFAVDKLTMVETYLDKGPIGLTDPSVAFIGTPYSRSSFGCYAPVIESCADKFLADNASSLSTYRLSDVSFRNLLLEVEQGNPVIIWASMYMKETYKTAVWNVDGKEISWIANEHCLVLYGYDLDRNVVLVADPLVGNTEYNIDLFELRYNELMKQAVVIK